MTLYSKENIEYIKEHIIDIMNNAEKIKVETLEPTIMEFHEIINNIIKPYIIKNKRICFGNYALHQYIKQKTVESIYDDNIHKISITFYSSDPIIDVFNICNLLDDSKYKFVSGRQVGEYTYIIGANFVEYCKIVQISDDVKFRTNIIDNILLVDPVHIYIEKYMIFNDPLNNSKVWEDEYKKLYELQKYYDIFKTEIVNIPKTETNKHYSEELITKTMIVIGKYAYNYYMSINNYATCNIDCLEVVSTDYEKDIAETKKYLINKQIKQYEPYFEYFGSKTVFLYEQKPIIIIYNTNICYPILKINNGVAPMTLLLQTLLATGNIDMASNLIIARNNYCSTYNKTVLDETPFQEFIIFCSKYVIESNFKKCKLYMQNHQTFNYYPNNKNTINLEQYKKKYNRTGNIV